MVDVGYHYPQEDPVGNFDIDTTKGGGPMGMKYMMF